MVGAKRAGRGQLCKLVGLQEEELPVAGPHALVFGHGVCVWMACTVAVWSGQKQGAPHFPRRWLSQFPQSTVGFLAPACQERMSSGTCWGQVGQTLCGVCPCTQAVMTFGGKRLHVRLESSWVLGAGGRASD